MKKIYASIASCLVVIGFSSCNNSSSESSTTTDTTKTTTDTMNTTTTTTAPTTSSVPLSKADSTFVMEAAAGNKMEVEAGQLAQQKAASQRVKDFGAMMVSDHSKAYDELKSFASGRGIMLPDSLPANEKKHLDAMGKLSGKAFDQHYVNMMVDDHKKDVDEFKKQSTSAGDGQLKTWAGNTLPVLQKHLDSIQAIKKSKM